MPASIADFIKNFAEGGGATNTAQATQYYDKFASTNPADREFDNNALHSGATEYLGQLPEDKFHQAAQTAFSQAQPAQRAGLIGGLISALSGHGVDVGSLAGKLGLQSTNPQQMGPADYSRLANYARTNQPEAMQEHVQSQPWLVKAMGSPVVMGALAVVAAKMLHHH